MPIAWAGTRCPTFSCSGVEPGVAAAELAGQGGDAPNVDAAEIAAVIDEALVPLGRDSGESPYDLHHDLQDTMQRLVGIIRTESELKEALEDLGKLKERAENLSVAGGRLYNPGWNLATDIPAMLTVSTLVTRAALERRESRGGHTRDDYPKTDPEFAKVNLVQRMATDGDFVMEAIERPEMPDELKELLEEAASS